MSPHIGIFWMVKRQLLLLRHAKSSWEDPAVADHGRPLSKRGRKAGAIMRQLMQSEGINPDLVYVSSARRTLETLQSLQPWDRTPVVEVSEGLYHATPSGIFEILTNVPDGARSVLLIGHNPGLQEFAVLLAGKRDDALTQRLAVAYPTGALAVFEIDSWTKVEPGSGRLMRFVTPRELQIPPS